MNEKDPMKTKAMETSLWEIECLKHHYCPSVSSLAKSIFAHDLEKDRLMKYQLPIQDFICSYQDFYLQEARLKKEGGRNINLNVEQEEENADKQDKELTEAEKQEAEEKQPKKRIKVDCPLRIGKLMDNSDASDTQSPINWFP